jgi:predicted small secreted protein
MKKFALAIVLVVTALSLGGCFVGKGKGKTPAPISTRN